MERRPDPAPIPGRQRRPGAASRRSQPRRCSNSADWSTARTENSRSACGRVLAPRNRSSAHPPATHQGPRSQPSPLPLAARSRPGSPRRGRRTRWPPRAERTARPAPADTAWPRRSRPGRPGRRRAGRPPRRRWPARSGAGTRVCQCRSTAAPGRLDRQSGRWRPRRAGLPWRSRRSRGRAGTPRCRRRCGWLAPSPRGRPSER